MANQNYVPKSIRYLKTKGFETFEDYFKSPVWKDFRKKYFLKDRRCRSCGNIFQPNLNIYLRHYSSIDALNDHTVFCLCFLCEEKVKKEFNIKTVMGRTAIDYAISMHKTKYKPESRFPNVKYRGPMAIEKKVALDYNLAELEELRRQSISRPLIDKNLNVIKL